MEANQEPSGAALSAALSRSWYHTIDLAPGSATAGAVDLRGVAPKLLPGSLAGKRGLDVGTFDGFWAFELEARGAQTVAVDVSRFADADWPPQNRERLRREAEGAPGDRFPIAKEALGSEVHRVACSIYDLEAGQLGGAVDYAVVGDLLLHLRDPVRGLEAVRSG